MSTVRSLSPQKSKSSSSQDMPQKSFKWLLELDANEIIEVNLPDIPNAPQELLSENIRCQASIDFTNQIEQIYLKTAKASKKKPATEESIQYSNINDIPTWLGLAKEVQIISPESFQWLAAIDSEGETLGIMNTCMGIHTNIPSQDVYHSILYWGCTGLDESSWLIALRSLFYTFIHEKCEWFYVHFGRHTAYFKHENNRPITFIANPTSQLKIALRKSLVSLPHDDLELENVPNMRHIKKLPPVRLEGKAVHAFYNYLANNYVESKLVAPTFFLNATLKSLNTTYNGEIKGIGMPDISGDTQRKDQKHYKLTLEGPISSHSIKNLCSVLQSTQNSFYVEISAELSSAPLGFPSSLTWANGHYAVKPNYNVIA